MTSSLLTLGRDRNDCTSQSGASLSLLRGNVPWPESRAAIQSHKVNISIIVTLSNQLNVEGRLKIGIPDIGIVTFVVVDNMAHEAILG